MFIILEPFHDRHGAAMSADGVLAQLRRRCYEEIQEAQVAIFRAPPVDGLGNAGGFKLMLEDRGDLGLDVLQGQADQLAEQANQQPGLVGVINTFRADTPQLYVDIDRSKVQDDGRRTVRRVRRRCSTTWAVTTSTTSINSAAPGR